MTSQIPPSPNVNQFNNEYWINVESVLTQAIADTKYLQFPVAQGNENLLDVNVDGNATFQNTLTIQSGVNSSVIDQVIGDLTISNANNSGKVITNVKTSAGVVVPIMTADSTGLTLAVDKSFNFSGIGIMNQSNNSSTPNTLNAIQCGTPNGGYQYQFRSTNVGCFSQLFMASAITYLRSNYVGSSTLTLSTSTAKDIFTDIVALDTTSFNVKNTTDITLNSTNPPTTTSTISSSTDSSTKIPTTAWVQSAISGVVLSSPIPYYQLHFVAPSSTYANKTRIATVQFNFVGTNWTVNEYFTLNIKYTSIAYTSTSKSQDYQYYSMDMDVYPNRCPGNSGTTDGPYGLGQNTNSPTNYPQISNPIWDTTQTPTANYQTSPTPRCPFFPTLKINPIKKLPRIS